MDHNGNSEKTSAAAAPDPKRKKNGQKRRKVSHACVYCRRSHMTCDEGRPCQRCIKRNIGHLCHDEFKTPAESQAHAANTLAANSAKMGKHLRCGALPCACSYTWHVSSVHSVFPCACAADGRLSNFSPLPATPLTFASEHVGDEFTVINDFLFNLDSHAYQANHTAETTTERFFLTAADPSDGTHEEKLMQVINAKYEAGFLKPYNYVNGYARLQKYMELHMSDISKQRIINVMGTFRPAFRRVAKSLTDIDLVLVEEAFERLLLDYDRVFSAMGVPACLWRRTGEIYKANNEFADLVQIPLQRLRDGNICIYELLSEDSAVNYWEKYGNIAFDAGQKAVLTSCMLKNNLDPRSKLEVSCCFSFTIRRDKYNIPTLIAGNFLPC
ncbi:hypothetical protein THASP1DRAFT_34097 [Thamnocephalis sphaerospora]|uniref:Zn(2)-C6 fungal-type domain-containing protein n=1 Tax=Thamnocephalis sphaerospora TaxID=78915 RepID=A0A4P9XXV5_9FUNG|nr:hypothetical protein THASP1DRAFT_34097 [Thamnocephalis sphaerospora]|eukprot:RKP10511.1 hypothetical protein THASP1DRAFT_34097 [Thamnocephalis sphaerospora]